jgi:crotonobetainyl-CoA:carnitine CoA-transferase CaiB-like acyl-CoA transferase
MTLPLEGRQIVVVGINAPALAAGARLASLGASVIKIEPPGGDPVEEAAPGWYVEATAAQHVLRLDLKTRAGRERAEHEIARADGLVTAMRPAALERLGLGVGIVAARHPNLVRVAIVGFPPPRDNIAGHDLTYLAPLGVLDPPSLPRVLIADLAGAERVVSTLLALLVGLESGRPERFADVALSEAAEAFAVSYRHGATAPGGKVGGGDVLYRIYEAADGWIAVAALESHFRERILSELGLEHEDPLALAETFRSRGKAEWEAWAEERDLPIVAVARRLDE